MKVSRGFSMPPKGNEGGMTSTSYRSQSYGPNSSSATCSMVSTPSNSQAAASATLRSAHTADRCESCRGDRSPTAKARR